MSETCLTVKNDVLALIADPRRESRSERGQVVRFPKSTSTTVRLHTIRGQGRSAASGTVLGKNFSGLRKSRNPSRPSLFVCCVCHFFTAEVTGKKSATVFRPWRSHLRI